MIFQKLNQLYSIANKLYYLIIISSFCASINAQNQESHYNQAYLTINTMLYNSKLSNFKEIVFLTENAYFDNQLNEQAFNDAIRFNTSICRGIIASGSIEYPPLGVA